MTQITTDLPVNVGLPTKAARGASIHMSIQLMSFELKTYNPL